MPRSRPARVVTTRVHAIRRAARRLAPLALAMMLMPVFGSGLDDRLERYDTQKMSGWTIRVNRDLQGDLRALVLRQLAWDLSEIDRVIPEGARRRLAHVVFWVEAQGATVEGGMSGRGMCYHPSREWLVSNGLMAEKAKGVEIVRAADFPEWRINQPWMVFHEMAHALHDAIDFEHPDVEAAWKAAMERGDYDEVDHNTQDDGRPVRAYACTNPKEYF
ncbi:MAG: hypothetical protein KDA28_10490, partial [Phycisphaerales bacterium]|nr:hypothetical protein [Phycisphaerales bacterium]